MTQHLPVVMCLLAALLFGASTPASKVLLDELSPLALAGLLYLGAALAVAPAALRRPWRGVGGRGLGLLAGAVVAGGIAGPALMLHGLRDASAGAVALWLNLETPATLVLGWLLFREHIDRSALLGVALVLAGSLLLVAPFDAGRLQAAALVAAACACWGLDNNLTAIIDGLTPAQVTFAKGLVAGTFNLAVAGLPGLDGVAWALGVGAVGYGLSLALYVAGAQQMGATRSQALFATAPFWGLAVAWVALAEPVRPAQLVAGAFMAAAVGVLARRGHAHHHRHHAARHTHWHRHDDGHHEHLGEHEGIDPSTWHCHEHVHQEIEHSHAHWPDLHHRHDHD